MSSKDKKLIKSKFDGFNEEFLTTYGTYKSLMVDDVELRRSLTSDALKLVEGPYASFYDYYCDLPFTTKKEKYIKFSKDTVKAMITKLHSGN